MPEGDNTEGGIPHLLAVQSHDTKFWSHLKQCGYTTMADSVCASKAPYSAEGISCRIHSSVMTVSCFSVMQSAEALLCSLRHTVHTF